MNTRTWDILGAMQRYGWDVAASLHNWKGRSHRRRVKYWRKIELLRLECLTGPYDGQYVFHYRLSTRYTVKYKVKSWVIRGVYRRFFNREL